jgi:hypothetical protein
MDIGTDSSTDSLTDVQPDLKPYFSVRRAKKLIGKRVIMGYTYLNSDGSTDHQEQKHGIITSAHAHTGISVLEFGTAKSIKLPPDLRGWHKAPKATYLLHSTGEHVKNPDYLTNWIVEGKTQTVRAHVSQQGTTTSSTFSFYSIGTALYGRSNRHPDGSYIATKWIIILMFPVFPIASFRIRNHSSKITFGTGGTSRHSSGRVALNRGQVVRTYLITYSILAAILMAAKLAATSAH